jgi:small-conductance mechanosensitive channel
VHDVLERIGLERSLVRLVGRLLRIALTIVVVFAALSLLGLQFLSESLNQGILFLPRLLVAFALVLAGFVVASFVRDRVARAAGQMDLRGPLPELAEATVIAVFVLTALGELGIPTAIVTALGGIALAAVALTFALAFGLGGRDLARQVTAGRYVTGAFRVGQEIGVGEWRGRIVAMEQAFTALQLTDGRTLRVPNHVLLESIVVVHDSGEEAASV